MDRPGQICGAGVVCDPVDDLLDQHDRRSAGLLPCRLHLATGARDQQLAHSFGLVLPGERVRRQVHQRLEHEVDRDDGSHELLDQLLGDSADSWLGRGHEGLRPGAGKLFPLAARDRSNLRERVLAEVVERADQLLRERGELPLPKGLSPHKLRHTFASILVALGTDPAQVMRQIGHRSAAFTLDVYTHMMASSPEQRERLKALVEGERRWGPAPLGRLAAAAYQEPILRALATLGGSARRKEVMASVEEELAPRFGVGDLEIVSGRPRWQADVDVARRRLLERGLVTNGSREGIWVLTEAGAERAAAISSGKVKPAGVQLNAGTVQPVFA